jgi:hypothetical protein
MVVVRKELGQKIASPKQVLVIRVKRMVVRQHQLGVVMAWRMSTSNANKCLYTGLLWYDS